MKKKVSIIGAAGLSGLELIHYLSKHPHVELQHVTSTKYQGQHVSQCFPQLHACSLIFESHDVDLAGCDVAFLAIPNQASLDITPKLLKQGIRVIDLSGVYRLSNPEVFQKYYGLEHTSVDLLESAIFGLPEINRSQLKNAQLVANPGCYPTGSLLGLLPMGSWMKKLARFPIIDAKSGVSGAGGRVENDATSYMNVQENFKAYKPYVHQHLPEIEQYLQQWGAYDPEKGRPIFTPHLLPVRRGILSSIYIQFEQAVSPDVLLEQYSDWAQDKPFVHLMPFGQLPELSMVQHTNDCFLGLSCDETQQHWTIVSAIDNLGKGASGQAIQNMNLLFGWDETISLR